MVRKRAMDGVVELQRQLVQELRSRSYRWPQQLVFPGWGAALAQPHVQQLGCFLSPSYI